MQKSIIGRYKIAPATAVVSISGKTACNKICGILDIDENCAINLPEPLMEMFDMKAGDKVLLLADKREGIAIVKCSQF